MLIDDTTQTNVVLERETFQDRVTRDGLELWKRQKEYERQKKIKEQKEVHIYFKMCKLNNEFSIIILIRFFHR